MPTNKYVKWNNIKTTKNLQFTTKDDPTLIDQLIAEINSNRVNQVEGTFTIEPLASLIGKDTFTTFSPKTPR